MCIITKLLIPPHNTYLPLLDSPIKNLKFTIPFFTNSKHSVFISQPASPPF